MLELLVTLCNRVPDLCGGLRDIFLLTVDVDTGAITPVRLPTSVTEGRWGMTGIARREHGYVCALQPNSILYLSSTLEVEGVYDLALARDCHSIAWHDSAYIVSTGTDSIVRFDPTQGERLIWLDNDRQTDTIHLNSVAFDGDRCLASAFGPKQNSLWTSAENGYVFDLGSGERLATGVYHPHSLIVSNGDMWFCESSRRLVRNTSGYERSLGRGYLRGMAIVGDRMFVGSTVGRSRSRSTGALMDNPAGSGELAGRAGISILDLRDDAGQESFIDVTHFAWEIYDVLPRVVTARATGLRRSSSP